jgi:tetratricopeptide (TPR) repeat protein
MERNYYMHHVADRLRMAWFAGVLLVSGAALSSVCVARSEQFVPLEFPGDRAAARDPRVELLRTGDALFDAQLYPRAESKYSEALAQFTAPNEERQRALTRTRLGQIQLTRGEFAAALESFRQVERSFLALDGDEGLTTVHARYDQGVVLVQQQRWAEAFALLNPSIEIFAKKSPRNDMFVVSAVQWLVDLHYHHSAWQVSERYARLALEVFTKAGVANHPRAAVLHLQFADILERLKKYTEAASEARQAVVLYGRTDNFLSARASLQLGTSLNSLEKWSEAEPYLLSARQRLEKFPDKEAQASADRELGFMYMRQKRFNEAQPHLEAALRFADSTNPPGYFQPLLLDWLFQLHRDRHELPQMEHYLRRRLAVKSAELATPGQLGEYNSELGQALAKRGQYAEAQEYLARAVPLYTQAYGSESLQVIDVECTIGAVHIEAGEYALAEARLRRVLAFYRKTKRADRIGPMAAFVGFSVYKQGKSNAEAQALLQEARDYYAHSNEPTPAVMSQVNAALADLAARGKSLNN